jgi:hypothetical protein
MTNIAMERSTMLLIGKPSISNDHLYHVYVSHNQMVDALAKKGKHVFFICLVYETTRINQFRDSRDWMDWINGWGISKKSYSL